jgi:hypothetical protein
MSSSEKTTITVTVVVGLAGILIALFSKSATVSSITNQAPVNIGGDGTPSNYLTYNLPSTNTGALATVAPNSTSGVGCGCNDDCQSSLAYSPADWNSTDISGAIANLNSFYRE